MPLLGSFLWESLIKAGLFILSLENSVGLKGDAPEMTYGAKILLIGRAGQVGSELQNLLSSESACFSVGRDSCDLEKASDIRSCLEKYRPQVIINAAAYTNVDDSEINSSRANAINWHAVNTLAEFAAKHKSLLVHYSTDYVFDGKKLDCWEEDDLENPINEYGKSKLRGDASIRASGCQHLIIRSSWIYSVFGNNFAKAIVRKSINGESISVIGDAIGVPTHGKFLAEMTVLMVEKLLTAQAGESLLGTYNVVPNGVTSWYEYASYLLQICQNLGVPIKTFSNEIERINSDSYLLPVKRPKNSMLCTKKLERNFGVEVPDWKVGVENFVRQMIQMRQNW